MIATEPVIPLRPHRPKGANRRLFRGRRSLARPQRQNCRQVGSDLGLQDPVPSPHPARGRSTSDRPSAARFSFNCASSATARCVRSSILAVNVFRRFRSARTCVSICSGGTSARAEGSLSNGLGVGAEVRPMYKPTESKDKCETQSHAIPAPRDIAAGRACNRAHLRQVTNDPTNTVAASRTVSHR